MPDCSLSSFALIKRLFSSSSLSAIRVASSAYLRLLIFPPAIYSAYNLNKQGDNIQPWRPPFPISNQCVLFIFGSKCCFLTCIQISQVVWYSHLFKNFPQFVMVHRVKGFSVVNEAEVDVFLEFFCFSMVQWTLAIWSVPLPFSKSGLYV